MIRTIAVFFPWQKIENVVRVFDGKTVCKIGAFSSEKPQISTQTEIFDAYISNRINDSNETDAHIHISASYIR